MTTLRPCTAEDARFVRESLFGPNTGELQWFGFSAPRLQADFESQRSARH